MFELQSKWIAGVLSGRIALPSSDEMMANVEVFYRTLDKSGIPKRYTHQLADYQVHMSMLLCSVDTFSVLPVNRMNIHLRR